MRLLLRRLIGAAFLLSSSLAVLPPQGFALCVDANGHMVIEAEAPRSARCCVAPEAGADENCTPASCESCVDITLSRGDASRSASKAIPDDAVPALCLTAAPDHAGPVIERAWPAPPAPFPAPPPLRTVLLRN
jgi:hypothetical protein